MTGNAFYLISGFLMLIILYHLIDKSPVSKRYAQKLIERMRGNEQSVGCGKQGSYSQPMMFVTPGRNLVPLGEDFQFLFDEEWEIPMMPEEDLFGESGDVINGKGAMIVAEHEKALCATK